MLRLIFTILLGLALTAAQPQLRGVNYGIQLPDGSCGPYSQVLSDFQLIATFAQAVKIYNMGFCNGAENSIIAARATGLKLFLGMAAGPPDAFQNELSILTRLAGQYGFANIIGITVGSEDLYRQAVSASTIAGYITQVKNVVKSNGGTVPVTHVDVYYLQPAEILAVEDIVMFNAFTFWEGQPIDNALATFISHYNSVVANANGKTVWIGETGWPANGATIGASVPSTTNAGTYAQQFICWANANGVPYFYFEAFDEPWKSSQDNGAIEASFGLYDSNRQKKDYFSFSCPNSNNQGGSSTTGTPATTASSASCQSMFASLSCTTSSEDPSQVDSNSVNNARGWLCANYPQFCTQINSGGQYSSCNSVEQISYAMSQYYNAYSSQGASACSFGGLGHVTGNSGSATTGNSAGSSTTGNSAGSSTTGNSAGSSTTGKSVGSTATPSTSSSGNSNTCQKASFCSPTMCACGNACYDQSQYCCVSGQLTQFTFCPKTTPSSGASSTTGNSAGSSTTGNSAGSSTTGNSAGSSTTGNSAGSSTTGNSAGSSTTGSATPTTSTGNACRSMFASLKCRTKSEDPSQVDSNSVNNARGWLCGNYPQYCTAINSGGQYSSCNSVEQISYGMNQYYNANAAQQGAQACNFGGLGQVVSRK